jgi:hypothetical protein
MKIRIGFVSNSSSSSFVIGCKEELCSCALKKALKIDHPLGFVMDAVANFIEMNAQGITLIEWERSTAHQAPDIMKELSEKFPRIYTFEADSQEGGDVGRMLYQHSSIFKVETDDLVIQNLWEND